MKRLILTLAVVFGLALAPRAAPGENAAVNLTGMWIGTWWTGKYEEPMRLELVQEGERLAGTVMLEADPRAEAADGPAPRPLRVTGVVSGRQANLVWVIGGTVPFTAELTLTSGGVLMGLGGDVQRITTGFTLRRAR